MTTTLFVSHSKRDKELLGIFSLAMSRMGIETKLMEFEDLDRRYAGFEISNIIKEDSDGLVVLLGTNVLNPQMKNPQYTRNWVAFETGVSVGANKRVWVLEENKNKINFPIPYVTDYLVIKKVDEDIRLIGNIFENVYSKTHEDVNKIGFVNITCPFENCNANFRFWTVLKIISCPVCRQEMDLGLYDLNAQDVKSIKANVNNPQLALEYDDRKYNAKILYRIIRNTKERFEHIGSPHRGDPIDLLLKNKRELIFNFEKKPRQIIPLLVDFDGDDVSYWYIQKIDDNKCVMDFRHRIPNHNFQIYVDFEKYEIAYNFFVTVEDNNAEYPPYREKEVISVRASKEDHNNKASNVITYHKDTKWISEEYDSWIELELANVSEINYLTIKWTSNTLLLNHFSISLSLDGRKYGEEMSFISEFFSREENFFIESTEPKYGKFVRLTFHNKKKNDHVIISHIKIFGIDS